MKLKAELDYVVKRFKQIKNLEEYAAQLKEYGIYKNYETRLVWDCLRMTVPATTICEWYDKYGCDDEHITTLAKTALKIVRGGT